MKKLTIIGGGSVRAVFFAHSLARRAASLHIDRLCLFDINAEKLRLIGALAQYAVAKVNPALTVELETDETRALTGTDYFVTTIRVGGDHTRVVDEEIAEAFGVLGQETTGAGGFFMAARSIPVLRHYCERIRALAPHAWIFNFTNPSGLVTEALRSLGFDRVIGICDTPSSTKLRIAEAMGYDNERFYLEFFGLNHLSWAHRATYEGKDVLAEILADPMLPRKVGELGMFDADLLQVLGHVPNEYLYYYYYREQSVRHIAQAGQTRGKNVERNNLEMLDALRKLDLERQPEEGLRVYLTHMYRRESSYMSVETGKQVLHVPDSLVMPDGEGYAGIAMDFAQAVETREPRFVVLSVPNQGSIEGLRDEDVVEITCRVDKTGAHPVPVGPVREDVFALLCAVKAYERLAVRAILEGSRTLAVRSLMAHPLIGSYPTASGLVDGFLAKHSAYALGWK